jgi:hypothetical protein
VEDVMRAEFGDYAAGKNVEILIDARTRERALGQLRRLHAGREARWVSKSILVLVPGTTDANEPRSSARAAPVMRMMFCARIFMRALVRFRGCVG